MTITISSELGSRLRDRAAQSGQDLNTAAEALLREALDWDADERADVVARLQQGLDASAAGRVRPAEDVFAEMLTRLTRAAA